MIVDWERKGAVEVDTVDDNDNGTGGRVYRGLATSFCLARCAQIGDEEQLLAWITEQLGSEIKDIFAHFICEERNGEEHGAWSDEGKALYRFEEEVAEAINYLEADSARAMGLLVETSAGDYLQDCRVKRGHEVCGFALTHDSLDNYVTSMARALEADARSEGYAFDDIEEYLLRIRDDMHDAWTEAHTCPCCGESCPESMLTEAAPSWECATCLAAENEED
jgi:hypothetical protein